MDGRPRQHRIRRAVIIIIAAVGVSALAAVITIWFAGLTGSAVATSATCHPRCCGDPAAHDRCTRRARSRRHGTRCACLCTTGDGS